MNNYELCKKSIMFIESDNDEMMIFAEYVGISLKEHMYFEYCMYSKYGDMWYKDCIGSCNDYIKKINDYILTKMK